MPGIYELIMAERKPVVEKRACIAPQSSVEASFQHLSRSESGSMTFYYNRASRDGDGCDVCGTGGELESFAGIA